MRQLEFTSKLILGALLLLAPHLSLAKTQVETKAAQLESAMNAVKPDFENAKTIDAQRGLVQKNSEFVSQSLSSKSLSANEILVIVRVMVRNYAYDQLNELAETNLQLIKKNLPAIEQAMAQLETEKKFTRKTLDAVRFTFGVADHEFEKGNDPEK